MARDYLELQRNPPVFSPVVLEGTHVRLEPLSMVHCEALCAAGADESIWTWYPAPFSKPQQMRRAIEAALHDQQRGEALPFAIVEPASGAAVGSTRLMAISASHARAEIGFTWLTPRCQRTPMNTQAKYLLLQHAFETLGLIRVEFKTDSLNQKSRNALLRIGAVEEGTLRNHMITHTGRLRHSVYFSVIDQDWPVVKQDLQAKLARPYTPAN